MDIRTTLPNQLPLRAKVLAARALIDGVVTVNRILVGLGHVPQLYRSGVVYRPERTESFVDASEVFRVGHGDCAHLAAWRVAELQNQWARGGGRGPKPSLRLYARPQTRTIHVQVRHSDGRIEDPSRLLGMLPGGGE